MINQLQLMMMIIIIIIVTIVMADSCTKVLKPMDENSAVMFSLVLTVQTRPFAVNVKP